MTPVQLLLSRGVIVAASYLCVMTLSFVAFGCAKIALMPRYQAFIVDISLFANVRLLYSRAPPIREHYAFFGHRLGESFILLFYAPDVETEEVQQLPLRPSRHYWASTTC